MKTIGLCMIVKNEAKVILQCLESVRRIVDYVLIEDDTGSTDGTATVVREWLDHVGMPGMVSAVPWRDFGYNRSHALASLRERNDIDYALMIDADDLLVAEPGFDVAMFKRGLSNDLYSVPIRQGAFRYQRGQLCSNHREFKYCGVAHEFLKEPPGEVSFGTVAGLYIESRREGARHRDPNKYHRDALVLEQALSSEEDAFLRSRYTFYLAQSYRDAGEREKALENYLTRAELGFWTEEIFESLYAAAGLMQAMGRPSDDVLAMYLRAAEAAPGRAEALHAASRLCRENNKFAEGFEYARRGLNIPLPADGLFVQPWVYDYALLDELAVNAYWIGRHHECLDACQRLLREGKMPADMHDRVKKNAEFAAGKIWPQGEAPAQRAEPFATPRATWAPQAPSGGTELMVIALRKRLGAELDRISLHLNLPEMRVNPLADGKTDDRPRVLWMHHDVNQRWVQWCKDKDLVKTVNCFVFVSYWQRQRYLDTFGLPPQRCVVLRHALDINSETRRWETEPILRCAYASAPYRGLSILLDAWERVTPANAELHIWSSMKLYLQDDGPYAHLYPRAQSMRGVIYHGVAPNLELRTALRSMHFLAYPSTFEETACLAAIEAMAAGCRLIVPSLGALPETTAGYACIYPSNPDAEGHVATFSETLAAELATPWAGEPELSLRQQAHCAAVYDWPRRLVEWRQLIDRTCDQHVDHQGDAG